VKPLSFPTARLVLVAILSVLLAIAVPSVAVAKKDKPKDKPPKKDTPVLAIDNSDLNKDGMVDSLDLVIFSRKYLKQDWEVVDWCAV